MLDKANTSLSAVSQAVAHRQREMERAVTRASTILEAELNDITGMVNASAEHIASLESDLEMFDALEQTRMAAQTRRDLTTAIEHHHAVVDAARRRTEDSMLRYLRSIGGAAVGGEAAFNSVCAANPPTKPAA